jgi:hypothetical protein
MRWGKRVLEQKTYLFQARGQLMGVGGQVKPWEDRRLGGQEDRPGHSQSLS